MDLGPFRVGDSPANPIVIDLGGDLDAYTSGQAQLLDYDLDVVTTLGPVPVTDDMLVFPFPADPFATSGLYTLSVTVSGTGGKLLQLDPIDFVVEDADGWQSLASARSQWADAPDDDSNLWTLLSVARDQCEEYAPAYTGRPPRAYRHAQLLQARNLWQAGRTTKNEFGGEYVMRTVPLTGEVKQLLRPQKGVPVLG